MNEPNLVNLDGEVDDIGRWIWINLVPKSGQAGTIQGELLRAVERLSWEAQNNGNGNWDSGFEAFIVFLEANLSRDPALSEERQASIHNDLERLGDFESPYLQDDLYDRLRESVVEFCRAHPELIPKPRNPDLHR
jgi:hypothetical protein